MSYARSLFLNFLVVFFVDRAIPGIEIVYYENVPSIGSDILFSLIMGFLNSLIFPFLALFEFHVSKLKLAIISFLISFAGFTVISMIPFGVQVTSAWGFILGGAIVWATAFITNYLEWQHNLKRQ